MVQNIKHLYTELDVEIIRDSLDVVVLENGEVQIRDAGADEDVAACIAAEIEAPQIADRKFPSDKLIALALEQHAEKARTKYQIELPAGSGGALEG